jgi:biopolymer transport protein ExbD
MTVGQGGPGGDPDVMVDINTTPLIDVMLVLLVMLIITIPIQLHSVNINMPVGTPPPQTVKPEIVKIDIDRTSVVYWNGEPVEGSQVLDERLRTLAAMTPQPELHIRPDRAAKYDVVASVLAASQRLGVTKLGIIGSEQFIE